MGVVLDVCFLAVVKVSEMKLYVVFWDIPIPRCVSTVFGELLTLECSSCLSF